MQKYCKVHTLSRYQPRNGHFLESESRSNVRVTSEPLLSAESEFAQTSEAGRKLRDNRRVCLKRLLGESLQNYYSL